MSTKIRINVFDLTPLNKILRCAKIGVYHTSICINEEEEYYFGFKEVGFSGIDSPQTINQLPSSMTGDFFCSIEMGNSYYSFSECQQIVRTFFDSPRWLSEHYNMLYHNCNTFTYELVSALMPQEKVNKFYPFWVRRFERIGKLFFSTSMIYIIGLKKGGFPGFGSPPPPFISADSDADVTEEAIDLENV